MNGIQVKKPYGRHWNVLLDAVVKFFNLKKITFDHAIYINFFEKNVSYLKFSTNCVLNATNNETNFPEPKKIFEEDSEIEIQ